MAERQLRRPQRRDPPPSVQRHRSANSNNAIRPLQNENANSEATPTQHTRPHRKGEIRDPQRHAIASSTTIPSSHIGQQHQHGPAKNSILKVGGGSIIEPSLITLEATDLARRFQSKEKVVKGQYYHGGGGTGERRGNDEQKQPEREPQQQRPSPHAEWKFSDPDPGSSSCCSIS